MEERKTIYLCLAHMSEDGMEQKYVKEAFDTNWVVPLGPNVNAFENELEKFVNVDPDQPAHQVVALSAGTAAVHLALKACGVSPGDLEHGSGCTDRGAGASLQGGDQDGCRRCCRSDPHGRFAHNGLSAERECGGIACLHVEQEGGMSSGMEADAQAARI